MAAPPYLELKPWILNWGPSAKVIGPRELKEQVETGIRKMAEECKQPSSAC